MPATASSKDFPVLGKDWSRAILVSKVLNQAIEKNTARISGSAMPSRIGDGKSCKPEACMKILVADLKDGDYKSKYLAKVKVRPGVIVFCVFIHGEESLTPVLSKFVQQCHSQEVRRQARDLAESREVISRHQKGDAMCDYRLVIQMKRAQVEKIRKAADAERGGLESNGVPLPVSLCKPEDSNEVIEYILASMDYGIIPKVADGPCLNTLKKIMRCLTFMKRFKHGTYDKKKTRDPVPEPEPKPKTKSKTKDFVWVPSTAKDKKRTRKQDPNVGLTMKDDVSRAISYIGAGNYVPDLSCSLFKVLHEVRKDYLQNRTKKWTEMLNLTMPLRHNLDNLLSKKASCVDYTDKDLVTLFNGSANCLTIFAMINRMFVEASCTCETVEQCTCLNGKWDRSKRLVEKHIPSDLCTLSDDQYWAILRMVQASFHMKKQSMGTMDVVLKSTICNPKDRAQLSKESIVQKHSKYILCVFDMLFPYPSMTEPKKQKIGEDESMI